MVCANAYQNQIHVEINISPGHPPLLEQVVPEWFNDKKIQKETKAKI